MAGGSGSFASFPGKKNARDGTRANHIAPAGTRSVTRRAISSRERHGTVVVRGKRHYETLQECRYFCGGLDAVTRARTCEKRVSAVRAQGREIKKIIRNECARKEETVYIRTISDNDNALSRAKLYYK